jgi:uncharacterized protein YdhG (YjbR/CyaY superfamily)
MGHLNPIGYPLPKDASMRSSAVDEGDYVFKVDRDWRPVVERLRAACRKYLTGYEEAMAYGMPTYHLNGQPEVAFARQAKYFSIYIMKEEVLDAHRQDLQGLSLGKGAFAISGPTKSTGPSFGRSSERRRLELFACAESSDQRPLSAGEGPDQHPAPRYGAGIYPGSVSQFYR